MCTICTAFTLSGPTCGFANGPDGATMSATHLPSAGLPTLSAAQIADFLTVDFWEGYFGVSGPLSFDLGPGRDLTVNLTALRPDGAALARAALDAWRDVTDITFVETASNSAEIMFSDTDAAAFGGPTTIRGTQIENAVVNVSQDFLRIHGNEVGSVGFFFYLHEVGHALGLGHPGNYNANANFGRDAMFANDNWQMSVMSYFGQNANPNVTASYAVPVSPMMADVVAIHRLYGTGDGVRDGNTAYGGSANSGGSVDLFGGNGAPVTKTIVDTGGTDSIDLTADGSGVRLDMRPGTFSDILGLTGNLAIAPGTTVENASLGQGADDVTGNAARNDIRAGAGDDVVRGGDGDDRLEGGAGNDTLIGGRGIDQAAYSGSIDGYDVSIRDGKVIVTGAQGTDTLMGVETMTFGSGAWFAPGGRMDLAAFSGVAGLSAAELTTFVEMYIAYFDRAPDAAGLFYWGTRLEDGMGLGEIAASFFAQDESREAFPDPGNSAALVDAAYDNLLERAPDSAGRAYWIDELDSGGVSRAEFMLAVINGAKANPDARDDVRTVTDKADIGLYFAVINGLSDLEAARDVMEAYDRSNPASGLRDARNMVDAVADDAGFTLSLAGIVDDPFATM